jgi:hypothetical protein
MPRILAIDWDRHEARGLLVATGPTGVSAAEAWAVPLATSDMAGLTAKQIGSRLAAAMPSDLGGKLTTIVGAGRDNVQMKLLSLPPAPADELPDMVRFQAEREFTALGSDAALDFIPLSGDAQTPHQVLAVALNPAGMAEARELCQPLGVEPDRIVLRACGAGALADRAGIISAHKVALIVNPLTDEADLTVQAGEQVFLMRTVRLPDVGQGESRQRALVGEIRRTVAAARQQLGDRQVDQVVLCCSRAEVGRADSLAGELGIPVDILDPAASAPAGLSAQAVSADSLARFAAVLGMALSEADRRSPIVDFANVRRRPEAQRFTKKQALAAAAAAIAVLGIGGNMWLSSWRSARELANLQNEIQILEQSKKQYDKVVAQADAVERWLATDVNWLDELEQTARRVRPQPFSSKDYPVNDDVVVTQLMMFRPPGREAVGGSMAIQAVAKNQSAVFGLEKRLRDERHNVVGGGGQQDATVPGYNWAFGLEVQVAPDENAAEVSP